jgi:flagellar biosynthesis GTPase FlhF
MRQDAAEASAQDEGLRARELVDMVRNELAGMRREMALSRQLDAAQPVSALPELIRPIAAALIEAGVPAALRTLLLDGVRDAKEAGEALSTMKAQLAASMGQAGPAAEPVGIHALIGPSGSGKTLMASRLAARLASSADSSSVAIISFADHRIGAWTQCQMMAARIGVDCFRVTNADLLGPMLDELASRRLVLIDTPSAGALDLVSVLQSSVPTAQLNLVIPADASASSLARFLRRPATTWSSLMATKLDEAGAAWPMIQALCNQPLALSFASDSPAGDRPAMALNPMLLIEAAFAQLSLQLPEPVPAPVKARSTRSTRSSARTGASRAA